jgi:hypothetical protein
MIFADLPQHRTLLERVRDRRESTRRFGRKTTRLGIEHHQRMVQALQNAATGSTSR